MEDLVLVTRAQRGDAGTFAVLVERYQTPVYNLAFRMLGNANDADDAAQETFLRAYARLKQFRADQKFATWLLSIAAHHCVDQLRRRRFQWLSLENDAMLDALASDAPEPDDAFLRRENQREIERLVAQLSPTSRIVVVLHYWYDLPLEEIARMTGQTLSAVKVKLHRARRALAGKLTTDGRQQTAGELAVGGPRSAVNGVS